MNSQSKKELYDVILVIILYDTDGVRTDCLPAT